MGEERLHLAGRHSHGYWFVNAAKRRTSDSRGLIVASPLRNRVRCCRAQPSSIASNTADAGSNGRPRRLAPGAPHPANPQLDPPPPPLHQMQHC